MQTSQFSNRGVSAIIKENLRRSWPISLVFFLILFCVAVFPLIATDKTIRAGELGAILSGMDSGLFLFEMLLPVIAANAVFRYLFTASGTTLLHSFPLDRRTLFTGNFISGLVLTLAPFVLILLSILPFFKMKFPGIVFDKGYLSFSETNWGWGVDSILPNVSDWLLFTCLTLGLLFFVYALSVFAAILTGTGSGQVVISYVLNFIVLFVFLIIVAYLSVFLIGFDLTSLEDTLAALHPLIYIIYSSDIYLDNAAAGFSLAIILAYLAIAIALTLAAKRLYNRRKLERAGTPVCFPLAETIIINVVTLVGMAGMGMMFTGLIYGDFIVAGQVLGCVAGAAITFMVATMLAQKTLKIFNLKMLKAFGVFAIIGVLFIAFTAFDITGFTNRVPSPSRVESAELSMSYPFNFPYTNYFSIIDFEATSQPDLQALEVFHRGMIEKEKARKQDIQSVRYNWQANVSLHYGLKASFPMERYYSLYSDKKDSAPLEALAGMTSFRNASTLENLVGYDSIATIDVDLEYLQAHAPELAGSAEKHKESWRKKPALYFSALDLKPAEMQELARCMDRDYLALDAHALAESTRVEPQETAVFYIEYRLEKTYASGYYTDSMFYAVTSACTETLACLDRLISR